ncbi:MAG: hypothetical protein RI564_04995 [Gracilimonas sp.]|jgi:hypothetical protein|nr:hypothetical protein [Gracilimonas sp.]
MKGILTILSGFLGVLFFEGFARLIITFYHRIDFYFYGISHLPSDVWMYVIFISVLTSTWLASMLVLTVMKTKSKFYAIIFGALLIAWRLIEIINTHQTEPYFYLLSVMGLHSLGVFLAFLSYDFQNGNSSI